MCSSLNILSAGRLTEADSLHGERMPDDPEIGHQHPPSVPGVSLRVLDAVQSVNENFPRAHLHLPDSRGGKVISSDGQLSQHTPAECQI